MKITMDYTNTLISRKEMENQIPFIKASHKTLEEGSGPGSEFLGWLNLASKIKKEEIGEIQDTARKIQDESEAFIIIGIGGSYLGARAVIEALSHTFYNELSQEKRNTPKIYYLGNNISSTYISDLLDLIKDKDISINIISKSGTTTEPAIAFRILKEFMEGKYGKEEAKNRIYVTTDGKKGALRDLVDRKGYKSFLIPENIGGRYSVFTPVGLLPIAVAGIDIEELLEGGKVAEKEFSNIELGENIAYQYAGLRNILYKKGKDIEIMVNYEPSLHYLAEWWKQLFGESEGKDGKGIYPSSVGFTRDLHSMGQYIQDGKRNLFETVIKIEEARKDITIKKTKEDLDGLNYLEGKSLDFINKKALEGTVKAHVDGKVPNIIINIPKLNEYYLGMLMYFFKRSSAISGYLLGVNPFNQPGVEEYKNNMFRLLNKPGY